MKKQQHFLSNISAYAFLQSHLSIFYGDRDREIPCLFYHLRSWRKLAIIQKPSAQVPKTFHQHGIIEKTKII